MPTPFVWGTPRFIGAASFTGTANNNGWTLNSPAACAVGDYLFVVAVLNQPTTLTEPSELFQLRVDQAAVNSWQVIMYSRTADATDAGGGGSYVWSTTGTAAPNNAVCLAFRDVEPTMVDIQASVITGTTNPVTTPGITPARPGLIITGTATRRASATKQTFTAASGTELHDGGNNGASTSYVQAWYGGTSPNYTLSALSGNSITANSATSQTDRASYTINLGAVHRIAADNVWPAVHKAGYW